MAREKEETLESKIPKVLPLLPLRNTVIYPHQILPLSIGREKSVRLIENAIRGDKLIMVVAQKDGATEDPLYDDLFRWGTIAQVMKIFKMPDGTQSAMVQGVTRGRILDYLQSEPYMVVAVQPYADEKVEGLDIEAMVMNLRAQFQKAVDLAPYLTPEHAMLVMNTESPGRLADIIVWNLNLQLEEKQNFLEITDVRKRLERVTYLLSKELQILELGSKIQNEVQGEISKNQREYYLREQLKAIRRELGEDEDERTSEINELRQRLEEAKLPEEAKKVADKELDRLSKIPPAAAEYTVSRTYLDWLIELPWSKKTDDNLDVNIARQVLDEDHYNLEKVKKRILEYLAVRQLKPDMKGPILCFVGPPGVGKTSLGRSIARAMGRKFARISLGGVHDEAEIRGHRRTYIGALPGRIVQGLKRAGVNNPIFMLDEIDKVGADFRGDPSSALLEVLDPEQNFSFSDHYLEVPFDLSHVLFIATANLEDPIHPALKDRLEIIELPGYTAEDKIRIAEKFLVPKQLEAHGLKPDQLSIEPEALGQVISAYTREAGVRNLEREIANICRGAARELVETRGQNGMTAEPRVVRKDDVARYLGVIKFFSDAKERISRSGVATGLAWTAVGGDILFVEATKMRGKGALSLTGHLGEVMKESAHAALSYIRSKARQLDIDEEIFDKTDIHIHVPAGAIPKDGPSAGVTMFTALVSLLTDRLVAHDVAMTGEITLRGLVLPVGGIKEKVLAAKRAGIDKVILPEKNRKDLEEIPQHVRETMQFHFASEMDDVIKLALGRRVRRPVEEKNAAAVKNQLPAA
jgi:ATP-dependent Lon protease